MNKAGISIRSSLLKRQFALQRFKERKEAYIVYRREVMADIEQARLIWKTTMEQVPDQDFNQ